MFFAKMDLAVIYKYDASLMKFFLPKRPLLGQACDRSHAFAIQNPLFLDFINNAT